MILKRLRNLWALSAIEPDKYSIGFKWTGVKKPQPEEEKIPKNPATFINL